MFESEFHTVFGNVQSDADLKARAKWLAIRLYGDVEVPQLHARLESMNRADIVKWLRSAAGTIFNVAQFGEEERI